MPKTVKKMPKITSWAKNAAKSFIVITTDSVLSADEDGGLRNFVDTNKDLFKDVASSAIHLKKTFIKTKKAIGRTEIYQGVTNTFKGAWNELKTGDFLGQSAILENGIQDKLKAMEDEGGEEYSQTLSTQLTQKAIIDSTEATTTMIGKSAEYLGAINQASDAMAMTRHKESMSLMGAGFQDLSTQLNKLQQYTEQLNNHMVNSVNYYTSALQYMEKISNAVENMNKAQEEKNNQEQASSGSGSQYSSVFGASGNTVDIKALLKLYGKNFKVNNKQIQGLLQVIGTPEFQRNPIGTFATGIMTMAIPQILSESIKSLGKTASTFLQNFALSMNNAPTSNNSFINSILSSLGVKIATPGKLDPSKYEKGPVPFDGITRMAIVKVIPEYLATIESLLSSKFNGDTKGKRYFDSSNGTIRYASDIKASKALEENNAGNEATSDLYRFFEALIRKQKGKTAEEQNDLLKAIQLSLADQYKEFENTGGKKIFRNRREDVFYEKLAKYGVPPEVIMQIQLALQSSQRGKNIVKSINPRMAQAAEKRYAEYVNKQKNGSIIDFLDMDNSSDRSGIIIINNTQPNTSGDSTLIQSQQQSNQQRFNINAATNEEEIWRNALDIDEEDKRIENDDRAIENDKFKLRKLGINKKPDSLLGKLLVRADNRLYEFMFGSIDDDGTEHDGFLGTMVSKMENLFDDLKQKLKSLLYDKKIKPLLNKAKEFVSPYWQSIKSSVSGTASYIGQQPKDLWNKYITNPVNKNKENNNEFLDEVEDSSLYYASGGTIPGTGPRLAIVSGGEKIINPNKSKIPQMAKQEAAFARALGLSGISRYAAGTDNEDNKKDYIRPLMREGFTKFVTDLTPKQDRKKVEETLQKITNAAPKVVGSTAVGGILGLISGVPMLGAALGTSVGLARNSETVQKFLFGTTTKDEKGNETTKGGIIPKSWQTFLKKAAPNVGKSSILGGLAGAVLPGVGILPAAIIGAGIGVVKSSDTAMEFLFGKKDKDGNIIEDTGLFKKDVQDFAKKAFPKMGKGTAIGAVTGLLHVGPFGILGNAAIGAGIGLLSTSEKVKDAILGKDNGNGKREGGLVGLFKTGVINPAKDTIKEIGNGIKHFLRKNVVDNLKAGVVAAAQTLSNAIVDIDEFVKNRISDALPIDERLKHGTRSVLNFGKKVLRSPVKLAANVAALPFKAVGAIGRGMTAKQIKSGRASNMTAAERLRFRGNNKGRFKRRFDDKYAKMDETLAAMDDNTISALMASVERSNYSSKNAADNKAYADNVVRDFTSIIEGKGYIGLFGERRYMKAMKAIEAGDTNAFVETVYSSNLPADIKETIIDRFSNEIDTIKFNFGENKDIKAEESRLRDIISRKMLPIGTTLDKNGMRHAVENIKTEYNARRKASVEGLKNIENEYQKTIVDKFNVVIQLLANPNDAENILKENKLNFYDKHGSPNKVTMSTSNRKGAIISTNLSELVRQDAKHGFRKNELKRRQEYLQKMGLNNEEFAIIDDIEHNKAKKKTVEQLIEGTLYYNDKDEIVRKNNGIEEPYFGAYISKEDFEIYVSNLDKYRDFHRNNDSAIKEYLNTKKGRIENAKNEIYLHGDKRHKGFSIRKNINKRILRRKYGRGVSRLANINLAGVPIRLVRKLGKLNTLIKSDPTIITSILSSPNSDMLVDTLIAIKKHIKIFTPEFSLELISALNNKIETLGEDSYGMLEIFNTFPGGYKFNEEDLLKFINAITPQSYANFRINTQNIRFTHSASIDDIIKTLGKMSQDDINGLKEEKGIKNAGLFARLKRNWKQGFLKGGIKGAIKGLMFGQRNKDKEEQTFGDFLSNHGIIGSLSKMVFFGDKKYEGKEGDSKLLVGFMKNGLLGSILKIPKGISKLVFGWDKDSKNIFKKYGILGGLIKGPGIALFGDDNHKGLFGNTLLGKGFKVAKNIIGSLLKAALIVGVGGSVFGYAWTLVKKIWGNWVRPWWSNTMRPKILGFWNDSVKPFFSNLWNKIKDTLIGEKNEETGLYEGGLLGNLPNKIIDIIYGTGNKEDGNLKRKGIMGVINDIKNFFTGNPEGGKTDFERLGLFKYISNWWNAEKEESGASTPLGVLKYIIVGNGSLGDEDNDSILGKGWKALKEGWNQLFDNFKSSSIYSWITDTVAPWVVGLFRTIKHNWKLSNNNESEDWDYSSNSLIAVGKTGLENPKNKTTDYNLNGNYDSEDYKKAKANGLITEDNKINITNSLGIKNSDDAKNYIIKKQEGYIDLYGRDIYLIKDKESNMEMYMIKTGTGSYKPGETVGSRFMDVLNSSLSFRYNFYGYTKNYLDEFAYRLNMTYKGYKLYYCDANSSYYTLLKIQNISSYEKLLGVTDRLYKLNYSEISNDIEIYNPMQDKYSGNYADDYSNGSSRKGFSRHIYQKDPSIAKTKFGNSTLGDAGCGPVAAANLLGGNLGLATQYAKQGGFIDSNGGTDISYFSSMFGGTNTTNPEEVKNRLKAGIPVVLLGKDTPNGVYGSNNHYVTAKGFDKNGNIIVEDPDLPQSSMKYPASKVFKGMKAASLIGRDRNNTDILKMLGFDVSNSSIAEDFNQKTANSGVYYGNVVSNDTSGNTNYNSESFTEPTTENQVGSFSSLLSSFGNVVSSVTKGIFGVSLNDLNGKTYNNSSTQPFDDQYTSDNKLVSKELSNASYKISGGKLTVTGSDRARIVKIAESQLGYHEVGDNDTIYGKWYGINYAPWCAMFISWCARTADISKDIIINSSTVTNFYNFFKEQGRVHNNSSTSKYVPNPGDLIIYQNCDHVGMVWKVNGDTLYTIEGNYSDQVISRTHENYKNKSNIYCFCSPKYSAALKTITIDLDYIKSDNTTNSTSSDLGSVYGRSRNDKYNIYRKHPRANMGFNRTPISSSNEFKKIQSKVYSNYGSLPNYSSYSGHAKVVTSYEQNNTYITYDEFLNNIITLLISISSNTESVNKIFDILSKEGSNLSAGARDQITKAISNSEKTNKDMIKALLSNTNRPSEANLTNTRAEMMMKMMKEIAAQ